MDDVFNLLTHETVATAAATVGNAFSDQSVQSKGNHRKIELPKRVPSKRQLLLDGLRRIGAPALAEHMEIETWATFSVKENCNGCQMCAFFCPTGALSKADGEGKAGLNFRVAQCTNCQLCREVCFWKAVELSAPVDLKRVIDGTIDAVRIPQGSSSVMQLSPDAKLKRLLGSIKTKTA